MFRFLILGPRVSRAIQPLVQSARLITKPILPRDFLPGHSLRLPLAGSLGPMRMVTTCCVPPGLRVLARPAVSMGVVRAMGHLRKLKTKKGAAKRFLVTGKGKLKRGHAGKGHLTSGKSKNRLRRLNTKVLLTGTWAKKMSKLILTGK